ncbi:unnamed protein product [Cylindrotheca closterium]|uniref:1-alkyl-2-acetylglycerophosphocholine esterase n=1 Tax=Cylindrotheca closterium TaxID=2856 RepID=A0AAD2G6X4_9STRA|nr:unnamed protein product [Cylindrotheca closterium]
MVATSLIQRLLWVCQYPGFSKSLLGPYENVGVIQGRIPSSAACQVFYPAAADSTSNKSLPYFRPRAVQGLAEYSGMDPNLFQFLSWKRHPCQVHAPPAVGEFPVVLFSHGLGGCLEMYTDICQQVASSGMIVVALEHEDGSGCFAETADGQEIRYKSPSSKEPYSRNKVVNFRKDFLEHRAREVTRTMEFFLGGWKDEKNLDMSSNGVYETTTDVWKQVLEKVDTKKGVALFGHSFGGASMVYTMQREGQDQTKVLDGVNSVTMLDPWAFALDKKLIEKGSQSSVPYLSVLSEGWVTNPETEQVLELHVDNPDNLYYMPHSRHASFSDSPWWLPRVITRRFGLRGKKEARHETIAASAKACINHMKASIKCYQKGGSITEMDTSGLAPLLPFPYSTTELKLPRAQQLSSQKM